MERQEDAKGLAQRDYEVNLEIYENKALMTYLSDARNTVFARYFPDIRKQVEVLLSGEEGRKKSSAEAREQEFLKICCAFSFTPTARKTKKSLIDQAVLGLISLAHGTPVSASQVLASAETTLGHGVIADESQVGAAIGRLVSAGWIESNARGYRLSTVGKLFVAGAEEETKVDSEAAIGDIIAEVIQALGEPTSDEERKQLEENARTVLLEYFRLNGLELANSILTNQPPVLVYGQATERLKEMARNRLREHLGAILFDALGNALSAPTDEQAKYFAGCSRAYLASQVLNIDPALREFQATRIAKKVFVLDTDFVLDMLIQDLPKSSVNRSLVNQLLSLGAKVLVPEEVLREVTTHLKISIRTFDYMEDYLNSISEDLLTAQVQNALVKGYWYSARGRGCYRAGFLKYRNSYYDDQTGEAFVAELVKDTLPTVNIGTMASALSIEVDSARYEAIRDIMLEFSQESGKGLYRTEEQNAKVAETDALLMVAVIQHNKSSTLVTLSPFFGQLRGFLKVDRKPASCDHFIHFGALKPFFR